MIRGVMRITSSGSIHTGRALPLRLRAYNTYNNNNNNNRPTTRVLKRHLSSVTRTTGTNTFTSSIATTGIHNIGGIKLQMNTNNNERIILNHQTRYNSSSNNTSSNNNTSSSNTSTIQQKNRLKHLRNVGVFAHVDAGKTTVTERMLALAGIVNRAGSVDTGNTVTDYLPAERERGITIQSAAISFHWNWHNFAHFSDDDDDDNTNTNDNDNDNSNNNEVTIQLIDTPGHVDFSVEVNRSVAVLDGAVLVIDAVAGVQAQTETVWRAMTMTGPKNSTSTNFFASNDNDNNNDNDKQQTNEYAHEPLPCIAFINKMDKEGCNFAYALSTLKNKLSNANPIAIQIPLFKIPNGNGNNDTIIAVMDNTNDISSGGYFVGVIDLIDMNVIIWPDVESSSVSIVEECIPHVYNLLDDNDNDNDSNEAQKEQMKKIASSARMDLIATLADYDETMEEYYLLEEDPPNDIVRKSLRQATLSRQILPVMTGAALRGRGVEPLLDAVADLLPSPIERLPPSLIDQDEELISRRMKGKSKSTSMSASKSTSSKSKNKKDKIISSTKNSNHNDNDNNNHNMIQYGHPLHPSLLALAFKVVHMKNKGSGDGRVVFARVYSGKISTRDTLKVITPPSVIGEAPEKARTERVGGMLELAGGQFNNLTDGICLSGAVCALVGLKSVVTGDTLLLASDHVSNNKKNKKKKNSNSDIDMNIGGNVCLAGVASPKPVLTVRIEAESTEQQTKLSEALKLLNAEDPSLHVEETDSVTLLSGLGELHIEVVVDRLKREFGLSVWIGKPAVAYRETVSDVVESSGLVDYDRTIGATRLQAAVHLRVEPTEASNKTNRDTSSMILSDPEVTIGSQVREYLGLDEDSSEEELVQKSELADALIAGCKGALMRGPVGSYGVANVRCHIIDVEAEGGLTYLTSFPGALRAAASSVLSSTMADNKSCFSALEPTMSVEITAPTDMVGVVLSDLTSRRGTVGEVFMGDNEGQSSVQTKALIDAEVPLLEILGYASTLRSITGGEGTFSAEYVGHSPCEVTTNSFQ